MASRSPEFLTIEEIENEDNHEDIKKRKASLALSIKADKILMLAGNDKDKEKIPLFYFSEGNA